MAFDNLTRTLGLKFLKGPSKSESEIQSENQRIRMYLEDFFKRQSLGDLDKARAIINNSPTEQIFNMRLKLVIDTIPSK